MRALDVITRQRPRVVALERLFAATSRGAALMKRITADPALTGCEIRIIAHDSASSCVSPCRPADSSSGTATAVAATEAPPSAPLDARGTRSALRFEIGEGVDVQIDGNPAALVELSLVGAQVISPTILRPNQRIRMSLPDAGRPVRFNAAVAWALFEIPREGPRYRAGIEFFDADRAAVTRCIETYKKLTVDAE